MAVKSYQAQAEGEISLSKGEKIKGEGAGCGQEGQAGQTVSACLRNGTPEASDSPELPPPAQRRPMCHWDVTGTKLRRGSVWDPDARLGLA